jgi:hypothetical protein
MKQTFLSIIIKIRIKLSPCPPTMPFHFFLLNVLLFAFLNNSSTSLGSATRESSPLLISTLNELAIFLDNPIILFVF